VIDGRARWSLHRGESYAWLRTLPDACADLVLTDVPYSSGGAFRGDRVKSTDEKYTNTENQGRRPDFEGDTRDQRGFLAWCAMWMHEALRVTKPGGLFATFIDWRMLPILTDAVQAGGWVWRGVAAWDKTEGTRPSVGGMRAQCEFIVWASAGARAAPSRASARDTPMPLPSPAVFGTW
jgi:site-specific DNA-methyltransferase (adenine-specific)